MAECVCRLLELQEEFLVEDLGTLYLQVPEDEIEAVKQEATHRDGTLDLEATIPDEYPVEFDFTLKVEISTVSHAKHMYCVMGEYGIRYRFVPRKDRILFDSKQLQSSAEMMLEFVSYCAHIHASIIILDPRKQLSFECPDFEDVYNMARFCMDKHITDGRFFTTDLSVVRRRQFVRNYQVRYTDYVEN